MFGISMEEIRKYDSWQSVTYIKIKRYVC
jgi:hypothetical protein